MSSKLGVGVIGCGNWGKQHARVYNNLENARLVGVYDIDPNRTIDLSNRFVNCKLYATLDSMINDPDIQAVSICVPAKDHYSVAKRVIQASNHCLIEKPITVDVKQARELLDLSIEYDVNVQVGHIERFNPAVQKALRMVKEGYIRELVATHHRRLSPMPRQISDVGVILDLMIHEFDIACLIGELETLQGNIYFNKNFSRYEVHANAIIKYKHKALASIEVSWISPRKIRTLELFGLEGVIQVEYLNQNVIIQKDIDSRQVWFHKEEPLKNELNYFVNCVLNDTSPIPNIQDGINALDKCLKFKNSAFKGLTHAAD